MSECKRWQGSSVGCRLFEAGGPATGSARLPVESLTAGTNKRSVLVDRSLRRIGNTKKLVNVLWGITMCGFVFQYSHLENYLLSFPQPVMSTKCICNMIVAAEIVDETSFVFKTDWRRRVRYSGAPTNMLQ